MSTVWTPPLRWIFGVATFLGIFSGLQSYRLWLLTIDPKYASEAVLWRPIVLNLVYWYIPASLTKPIFRFAHRFPIDSDRWMRSLGAHAVAAFSLAFVHACCMVAVRSLLMPTVVVPSWTAFLQRIFLTNLDWVLMTYSAIVGLSFALTYYRESRARAIRAANLETSLAEARLKTLEAELHPHFLFNTLHAISTLVHTAPDAADRMISRLSDLLRITFDRSGTARVTLHEETEFLQKYLEIEQTRFQDRLQVVYDIDPDTLDAEVPRLILQPLVENAIKHGVSPRPGPGTVRIASSRDGDALWLEVRDDGVGLAGSALAKLSSGVGLSNTRARLECLYGTAQALEFSETPTGLTVRLRIPFHRVSSTSEAAPRVA
jgi:signal transduction histidine kinase